MSGFELAGSPEACATGICVQDLQPAICLDHYANVQAELTAEDRSDCARLRLARLHAQLQVVVCMGVLADPAFPHGSQTG